MEDKAQKILKVVEEQEKAKEESLEYKIHQSIGKVLEEYNIDTAAIVFTIPERDGDPALFCKGHFYDSARLLAMGLRELKSRIYDDLA